MWPERVPWGPGVAEKGKKGRISAVTRRLHGGDVVVEIKITSFLIIGHLVGLYTDL